MNTQEINKILTDAIYTYGKDAQIWMAIEEMSELSNALAKYRRGRITKKDICEEIADVEIMCFQMAAIFGNTDVEEILQAKMERLKRRLEKHHIIDTSIENIDVQNDK